MSSTTSTASISKTQLWAGRIISALPVLFLLFDSVIHIMQIQPVVDGFKQLGYPLHLAMVLGIVELLCVVIYIFPPTSVLGAILLTGYLGGAVASNVRIEASLFGNILFPIYVALFIWGGLYLRSQRMRDLLAWRGWRG